jgi:hypothetical protein
MSANILNLLIQLKTEWAELQININKINKTITKIVGNEESSNIVTENNENLLDIDIPKWERVLKTITMLGKSAKFQDIMNELTKQGINDTKEEHLRIRSVIHHLTKKKLITNKGGYYCILENKEE